MSHELHLVARRGALLDAERLAALLAKQRHWRRVEGATRHWWYENPDTGVYGSLEPDMHAVLNYVRPTFFGREFLALIVEIAGPLDLLVVDPQDDDIVGSARPKPPIFEELLSTWEAGNAKSAALAGGQGLRLPTMPRAEALEWWMYMRARTDYQMRLGESVFAPELRLVRRWETDRVLRLVTWVEGNPALFPACDLVAVLGPHAEKEVQIHGVVDRGAVARALAPHLVEKRFGGLAAMSLLEPDDADAARRAAASLSFEPFAGFDPVKKDEFLDLS